MDWEWHKGKTLQFLTIPEWSFMGVETAFSTRNDGVSRDAYSSLNLAFHVADNSEKVLENRKIFLAELGLSIKKCVASEQVHGTNVVSVSEEDLGRGMTDLASALPRCDGMVTRSDIGLMAFFADCAPLFFYNPEIDMIGLAHAGWRGTAQNIVSQVMDRIRSAGGSAEDTYAAIGPCIGSCCYEVGEDVAQVFKDNIHKGVIPTSEGKYRLDLVKANLELLLGEGISSVKVSLANLCTFCERELFYSYRREGITGRMAGFITKRKGVV
ncbi:MAG: Laccase domain protein YfiH [Candidatus Dichloromethanomonas elyunquensis]|nr:MAG: Laccase domain protein YfiH [Candidatus Dichloromethanomonas elyunquensis]